MDSRGVEIRMMIDNRVNIEDDEYAEFKKLIGTTIQAKLVDPELVKHHFIIADGRHIRLEKEHKFHDHGKGVVLYDTLRLAAKYRNKFLDNWSEIEPFLENCGEEGEIDDNQRVTHVA